MVSIPPVMGVPGRWWWSIYNPLELWDLLQIYMISIYLSSYLSIYLSICSIYIKSMFFWVHLIFSHSPSVSICNLPHAWCACGWSPAVPWRCAVAAMLQGARAGRGGNGGGGWYWDGYMIIYVYVYGIWYTVYGIWYMVYVICYMLYVMLM